MMHAACIPSWLMSHAASHPGNHPCLQTKDTLTLRASAFGSKCELPEKFLKKIADAGVLEAVSQFAKYKEDRALKKSDGAKRNRLTGVLVALESCVNPCSAYKYGVASCMDHICS